MDKLNFQNGVTKVNAETFNTFQNNIDNAINTVDNKINTVDNKINNVSTKVIPDGGNTGQVLAKNSSTDGDVSWKTVAPRMIKNEVTTSLYSNIVFLTSFEEGIYQFVVEGYMPANVGLHFGGLTDSSKFYFSATNISSNSSTNKTLTRQWYDNGASTFLPVSGYNDINRFQITTGTIEIRDNILTYSALNLVRGNGIWDETQIIGRVELTTLNCTTTLQGVTSDKFKIGTKVRIYKIAD